SSADEVAECFRQRPVKGRPVGSLKMTLARVVHSMHDHPEQRQRFECGEESTDRKPVTRRANPEIMMAESEDAGAEHQRNLDVQPALDHTPRRADQMNQRPRHDASDQYLPRSLDPQMHQPPPPKEV